LLAAVVVQEDTGLAAVLVATENLITLLLLDKPIKLQ
jgi:hypothetical protein